MIDIEANDKSITIRIRIRIRIRNKGSFALGSV